MGRKLSRAALALLPALVACGPVQELDAALRRVDVLDRVFEPGRYPPPGAAPPPYATLPPQPLARPYLTPEPALPEPLLDAPPPAGATLPPLIAAPPPKDPRLAQLPVGQPVPPPPEILSETLEPVQQRVPSTEARLRENPWLVRFWSELTPDQQGRVRRAMVRAGGLPPEPASLWDPLGLTERVLLVYGNVAQ